MVHRGTRHPLLQARDSQAWRAFDRYFTLRFSIAGKQVEEPLGLASEGWTVELPRSSSPS